MPAADRDDLHLLKAAAEEAGATALGFFRNAPRSWLKGPGSPVTEADIAANAVLRERLTAARPDYGWLSEESPDGQARLATRRLFVIDPIDGTRSFIAGTDDWAVSASVVEDGRPVVGVLVRPATGEIYTAVAGGGATLDGRALTVAAPAAGTPARTVGPGSALTHLADSGTAVERAMHVHSLALRIALVADGRLDVALAKAAAYDWDVAAADIILSEAGGALLAHDGRALRYNAPDPRHPPLVAAAPALAGRIAALLGGLSL